MAKISCSAVVRNEAERKALMAWVRTVANGGFSELGTTINMIYVEDEEDIENSSRKWAIIHTFEQYDNHSIEIS